MVPTLGKENSISIYTFNFIVRTCIQAGRVKNQSLEMMDRSSMTPISNHENQKEQGLMDQKPGK